MGAARTSVILGGIATGKREERDAEEAEAEKRLTDVERRRRRKITHHATQLTSVTDMLRINVCKEQLAEALKGELPVLEIQVPPPWHKCMLVDTLNWLRFTYVSDVKSARRERWGAEGLVCRAGGTQREPPAQTDWWLARDARQPLAW